MTSNSLRFTTNGCILHTHHYGSEESWALLAHSSWRHDLDVCYNEALQQRKGCTVARKTRKASRKKHILKHFNCKRREEIEGYRNKRTILQLRRKQERPNKYHVYNLGPSVAGLLYRLERSQATWKLITASESKSTLKFWIETAQHPRSFAILKNNFLKMCGTIFTSITL